MSSSGFNMVIADNFTLMSVSLQNTKICKKFYEKQNILITENWISYMFLSKITSLPILEQAFSEGTRKREVREIMRRERTIFSFLNKIFLWFNLTQSSLIICNNVHDPECTVTTNTGCREGTETKSLYEDEEITKTKTKTKTETKRDWTLCTETENRVSVMTSSLSPSLSLRGIFVGFCSYNGK